MSKQSDILVQKLKPNVGVGDVDIYPYTSLFTLDVIFGKYDYFYSMIFWL